MGNMSEMTFQAGSTGTLLYKAPAFIKYKEIYNGKTIRP